MIKLLTAKPLWVNILAALILTVGLLFVIISSLDWFTRHGKSRTVPSVVGKNFDTAQEILQGLGFEVVVQDSIYQDTLPGFSVIKQIPDGDAVVKVNRTVYLTINRAVPPVVEMPNLIGFSFRGAEMVLRNMGLRVGDTSYKSDFAKNSVLEQLYQGERISPGTKLQMGTEISLVLGSGVGRTEFVVPALIGMTYGHAKALLEANGLAVGIVFAPGIDDTLSAFIVKQNPPRFNDEGKRQRIRPGQLMDLWLSTTKPITDSSEMDNQFEY